MAQVDSVRVQKAPRPECADPQQESASPYEVPHGETVRLGFEAESASLRLRSRFDCDDAIAKEPTTRGGSFTMAPATGIEPVTTP